MFEMNEMRRNILLKSIKLQLETKENDLIKFNRKQLDQFEIKCDQLEREIV